MTKRLIGFAAGAALLGAAAIPVSSAFAQSNSRTCGNYEVASLLSGFQTGPRLGFASDFNNNQNPNTFKAAAAQHGQQTVAGFITCA